MIIANVHEVKVHFSAYLAKLQKGGTVVVCKRNIPIEKIRAIPQHSKKTRPIGLAKGIFDISETFFDCLPEDIINSFCGK
jgi:antitoxin (DNA-binding transcriptional repressor) of toxin-antitoxin stability system